MKQNTIRPMLFKYWVVCLLLFILFIQARASSFMPAVTNYLAKDYEAGYQNWACAQGSNGEMYFGNSQGLLVYDGYRWTLHKVPGNHIVRSVYVKEDRIYVGAFEEFGYFKYSEAGTLRYHSLSKFLKNFPMENNEIWNIVELDGRIYFQSFSAWFSYDGKMVHAFRNRQQQPLYFYTQNGHIYTQMIDEDFYEFDGKDFLHLFPRSQVNDDNVVALLPDGDDSFLMVTENNGLFRYNGDITPWKTDIDAELKKQRVNRAVMTNDSIFMIGTVLNGIYAIDRKGHCLWHFNLDNRLDNNTVLGLFCDKDNNVWAALDDGIAYIHHNSPVMLLTPANHETKLGMVYDIAHRGDCFYLATNQGLYEYHQVTENLRLLPHTEGQNWYVKDIDGQLFAGNNAHTLLIGEKGNVSVISNTNSSTCLIKCTLYGEEILLESSYANLRIYKKKNGQWTFSHVIDGFIAPVMHLEVDQSGVIWASHMYQGVYKIVLSDDLSAVKSVRHISHLGSEYIIGPIQVMKMRGRIVFSSPNGFYTYDDITRQIIPFQKLNAILPYIRNAHSVVSVTNDRFWLSGSHEYVLVEYAEGEYIVKQRILIELFEKSRASVVYITTAQLVRDVWTRNVFSVPRGTGSGFIWDDAGHVVTNFHVIQGASEATVKLADGRDYQAALVGTSPAHDIAVLKIEAQGLTPAEFGDSSSLQVGDDVVSIGNPLGEQLRWTMTNGIISAINRDQILKLYKYVGFAPPKSCDFGGFFLYFLLFATVQFKDKECRKNIT